jgi:hypothetical protein
MAMKATRIRVVTALVIGAPPLARKPVFAR